MTFEIFTAGIPCDWCALILFIYVFIYTYLPENRILPFQPCDTFPWVWLSPRSLPTTECLHHERQWDPPAASAWPSLSLVFSFARPDDLRPELRGSCYTGRVTVASRCDCRAAQPLNCCECVVRTTSLGCRGCFMNHTESVIVCEFMAWQDCWVPLAQWLDGSRFITGGLQLVVNVCAFPRQSALQTAVNDGIREDGRVWMRLRKFLSGQRVCARFPSTFCQSQQCLARKWWHAFEGPVCKLFILVKA